MKRWTLRCTCATVFAAMATVSTAAAAGGLTASATVSPTSGYSGAQLVATYSFTSKSSCSAFHGQVSWSFGSTTNWATSPAPSGTGGTCTSSTPSIAPPTGAAPASYIVCGTDSDVTSTPACATYTIKPPAPSPLPAPTPSPNPPPQASSSPSPSESPSPSPSPTGAPVTSSGTPSGTASPGSAPAGSGGGDSNGVRTAARSGGILGGPWTAVLLFLVLAAAVWRFRSWLMGVLENVVVLGRSGADLETELLHHQPGQGESGPVYTSTAVAPSPPDEGAAVAQADPPDLSAPAAANSGPQTVDSEPPPPEQGADPDADALDGETPPPGET